jgi:tetratricopeptide (TPR) repeat protein
MCRALLVTAVALVSSIGFPSHAFAQTGEEEAVKAVVRAESTAFYGGDQNGLASTWAHDADVSRTLVGNGQYANTIGWDKISAQIIEQMKGISAPLKVNITNDNFIVHINGGLAAVQFQETIKSVDTQPEMTSHSREYRVLAKGEAGWRIVSQVTIDADSFGDDAGAMEARLNNDGYALLKAQKPAEAIELFKLVVKLFPQSWNAYDSLGEAYGVAGNKAAAIENYEKSLELNPKNENGRAALAKLKGK